MASKPNFSGKMGSVPEKRIPRLGAPASTNPASVIVRGPQNYLVTRVQHFPLFAGLSPQECSAILGAARVRPFTRGQNIYIEGDQQRQVMLLTFGSAKMVQCGEDGSAVILRLCGPGELIGTLGISMQERYRCTSQALTPCSALLWDSEVFESLSCQFPSLRLNVAYILYKLLEDMEDRFREISTECVSIRLCRQVLRLVEQVGIRSNQSVEIQITREELAQLIGTTLYTVSRLLSKWDRKGIVTTRREGFSVNNVGALKGMINECGQEG
jgi:CRP/FNR family transcriptional regulator, nitrogen oxide reductase regulator